MKEAQLNSFKLLIVIDSLGAGGAEKSTQIFCDYLYNNNLNFKIICLKKVKVGVQENMLEKGYKIDFLENLSTYKQINYIINDIRSSKYTLVHSILLRSNMRVRLCKVFTSFIHIESLVNTTYDSQRFSDPNVNKISLSIYKIIDRLTINRYVNHFHSITNVVKQHYINELGIKPHKLTVIYRGRESHDLAAKIDVSQFGFSEKDFIIVNNGRHEFQKGQLSLVKAISLLVDRNYNDIKLLILGRSGNCTQELKQLIDQTKLGSSIHLAEYRNDVPDVLKSCQLFAFPSLYEGLGGSVIEAQAAGLPIICNNIDVMHEVVQESKNAEFFETQNPESIVKKILYFYNNRSKLQEYGEYSLFNYKKNFSLDNINKKMLDFYFELCGIKKKDIHAIK